MAAQYKFFLLLADGGASDTPAGDERTRHLRVPDGGGVRHPEGHLHHHIVPRTGCILPPWYGGTRLIQRTISTSFSNR